MLVLILRLNATYGSSYEAKLQRLEARILHSLNRSSSGLLLDMNQTRYVGAGFLSVLIRCGRQATVSGRHLGAFGLQTEVEAVMGEMIKQDFLDVMKSRESAVHAFRSRQKPDR